jgi:regulatory protein
MFGDSDFYLSEKLKLESFCAYQDRCIFDIKKKLKSSLLSEEKKEQLITELIQDKFIDDERFALSFAQGKQRIKKWGISKIKAGLKAKQISTLLIDKALETIDKSVYLADLTLLIEKKKRLLSNEKESYKKEAKIIRYLLSKGYQLDDIFKCGIRED